MAPYFPTEPSVREGVLDQPLPPVRTEGLSEEEIRDVTIYRNAHRAVVNVLALRSRQDIFGRTRYTESIGSGCIIDQQAHVITNNHVIEGADRVAVTLYDGSIYPATVLGTDPELDIAVLEMAPAGRQLVTLRLGDSSAVQVGQRVYALGSPFGLEGTLTGGIVSAVNRPLPSESGFILRNLIQTDAAINTGNSGGPLLNGSGEVLGINVMIYSPSGGNVGVGFAIPANSARRVIDSIIADGQVERGWIRISAVTVTPNLAYSAGLPTSYGVLVTWVHPGENAKALRDGREGPYVRYGITEIPTAADIITKVDGTTVRSTVEFLSLLEPTEPGDVVQLTVLRSGEEVLIPITLSERPSFR